MRIDYLIHLLRNGKEQYILTKEGTLDKFLGINITPLAKIDLSSPSRF